MDITPRYPWPEDQWPEEILDERDAAQQFQGQETNVSPDRNDVTGVEVTIEPGEVLKIGEGSTQQEQQQEGAELGTQEKM